MEDFEGPLDHLVLLGSSFSNISKNYFDYLVSSLVLDDSQPYQVYRNLSRIGYVDRVNTGKQTDSIVFYGPSFLDVTDKGTHWLQYVGPLSEEIKAEIERVSLVANQILAIDEVFPGCSRYRIRYHHDLFPVIERSEIDFRVGVQTSELLWQLFVGMKYRARIDDSDFQGIEFENLQFFDSVKFDFVPVEKISADGLYQFLRFGKSRSVYVTGNTGDQVDRSFGRILAAATCKFFPIGYDSVSEILQVPWQLSLPELLDRALCLFTGSIPQFTSGKLHYFGIPKNVGAAICDPNFWRKHV